jgi:hypothetical protein
VSVIVRTESTLGLTRRGKLSESRYCEWRSHRSPRTSLEMPAHAHRIISGLSVTRRDVRFSLLFRSARVAAKHPGYSRWCSAVFACNFLKCSLWTINTHPRRSGSLRRSHVARRQPVLCAQHRSWRDSSHDMAQHSYRRRRRKSRFFGRTRSCSQKRGSNRFKDLHRSYIPEVGPDQRPLAGIG